MQPCPHMMFPFVLRERGSLLRFSLPPKGIICLCFSILSILGCDAPENTTSEEIQVYLAPDQASDVVESAQEIAFENVQARLRASGHLDGHEHIFFYNGYVDLPCVQVISTEALLQIQQRAEECPSIVVEDAFGFDMVIAYRDESCPEPPTLIVETIRNKHLLVVDTERDRGICESDENYRTLGIDVS